MPSSAPSSSSTLSLHDALPICFFLGLNADEIDAALFFAEPGYVRVRIDQTRNHRRALQINHTSLRAAIFFGFARTPDKNDPRPPHGDSFGVRLPDSR